MKALMIGATGATGKDLLNVLLDDPAYTAVAVFVRRSTGVTHTKLAEVITDFDHLASVADRITGDVFFSVLGTTLKAAGSKEKQWAVDYDIPLQFASIARQNGVHKLVLLSSYGASSKSKLFYSKMKGALEDAIEKLHFKQLIIFRPGLLLRNNTDRLGEKISSSVLKFLNSLGLVKKFQPMPTKVLAQKMAKSAIGLPDGRHVIELDEIFRC